MKPRLLLYLSAVLLTVIAACSNSEHPKTLKPGKLGVAAKPSPKTPEPLRTDSIGAPTNLFVKNDSTCVVINNKTYCIPKDTTISVKMPFAGIYEIKNDSIKRSRSMVLNNWRLFVTYEDVGFGYRGQLYVFDVKKKKLIRDAQFNRNYLYSASGIFIIDKISGSNKIFAIEKSRYYEEKGRFITFADLYSIGPKKFNYIRSVPGVEELAESDSLIIKFYDKELAKYLR